jgi:hypothetical protein
MRTYPLPHGQDPVAAPEMDIMSANHTAGPRSHAARIVFGWRNTALRAPGLLARLIWTARLIWGEAPVTRGLQTAGAVA